MTQVSTVMTFIKVAMLDLQQVNRARSTMKTNGMITRKILQIKETNTTNPE